MCVLLDLPVYETEGTIHVDVDVDERPEKMAGRCRLMCERTAVLWVVASRFVAKRETRPMSATDG